MGLPRLHQKLSDEEPRLITKAYDIRAHGAVIRNIYFDIANARIVIASFFHANNKFWNIQLIDACSKIFCCLDSILLLFNFAYLTEKTIFNFLRTASCMFVDGG